MTDTGDDRKPDIHDGPLVAWERREYRQYKPVLVKMADNYIFYKKLYRVLAYTCGYVSAMVTGLWFAKDYIWAITKAVIHALSTMPS
jgi:hypothetical protein